MPIPPFDAIYNVLPPHLGDPRVPSDLSPYPCDLSEVCGRFNTSPARTGILNGFLDLREILLRQGIQGFQWVSGSFVEDIEAHEGRDPKDVDVITFVHTPGLPRELHGLLSSAGLFDLLDPEYTKANFKVDHYFVPLGSNPTVIVDFARYWYGLFSHRRDSLWKGMLRVELIAGPDDSMARASLGGSP